MNGRDMLGLIILFVLKGVRCQDFEEILASSAREREREVLRVVLLLCSTSVTLLLPTMAKGGESGLGRARKERAEDIRMIRGTMGNELRVEHPWYANCLPCTSYEHPNCIARHFPNGVVQARRPPTDLLHTDHLIVRATEHSPSQQRGCFKSFN